MSQEVTIGSKIKVKLNGEIKELEIVGSADVNVFNGKISYLSPIGEALLGRKVGEVFKIKLPSGKVVEGKVVEVKIRYK